MSRKEGRVFCPHCENFVSSHLKEKSEILSVKGTRIEVQATVRVCDKCTTELFDRELDGQTLQRAYASYRTLNGLLFPEQIRGIREQYGLSQMAFAKVLGLGDKTIARYETGSLPDEAPNNLITLAENKDNFRTLLWKNRSKLKDNEFRTALQHCEQPGGLEEFDLNLLLIGGEAQSWEYDEQPLALCEL